MITITKTAAICSLGENLDEIFSNAVAGKLCDLRITADLPEIEKKRERAFDEILRSAQNDRALIKIWEKTISTQRIKKSEVTDQSFESPTDFGAEGKKYDLRCNQILLHCVNQIKPAIDKFLAKYDKKKIGVVIATTNTGIDKFEETGEGEFLKMSNPAEFLRDYFGLEGYFSAISTACSSGIKVFSTAKKLMENGVCDAVIVGGTDEISRFPLAGFSALEVLSDERSIPMSKNRKGMNISEAGALFLLEKNGQGIQVAGIGETSDAYHASTPDPDGIQAARAIQIALDEASLSSDDIDYINLHGTGTVSNDIMETNAVYEIFKNKVPASSTKPLTGHCLGAAASIEVALCYMALEKNMLLPHIYDGEFDETLPPIKLVNLDCHGAHRNDVRNIVCNAFGFGGTNAVIVLSKKYDLEKILPHNHPMILIDDIVEVNLKNEYIISKVTISENNMFFDKELNGVSYITGIEYMAQTIGCYAYLKRGEEDAKIGFLLGTRSYKSEIDKFENGKTYYIKAKEIFGDNQLVSFECLIYNSSSGDKELIKSIVNVYQPDDASEFLAE